MEYLTVKVIAIDDLFREMVLQYGEDFADWDIFYEAMTEYLEARPLEYFDLRTMEKYEGYFFQDENEITLRNLVRTHLYDLLEENYVIIDFR